MVTLQRKKERLRDVSWADSKDEATGNTLLAQTRWEITAVSESLEIMALNSSFTSLKLTMAPVLPMNHDFKTSQLCSVYFSLIFSSKARILIKSK